jgi:hypothetical protein
VNITLIKKINFRIDLFWVDKLVAAIERRLNQFAGFGPFGSPTLRHFFIFRLLFKLFAKKLDNFCAKKDLKISAF